MGCIGLPTACILATSGYDVLGVDIDDKVIAQVLSVDLSDSEPNLKALLLEAIHCGHLKVSNKIAPADIHIVAVPTLVGLDNQPDISYVNAAIDNIKPYLRPKDLVIIESTCPIGTTEEIAHKLRDKYSDIRFAYCPERVLPGNILYELIHNDRVVGGVDDESTLHAINFYKTFVKGNVFATNSRMAEAVKLAENSYRDINIAYANELSMIASHVGLNVNELIGLANGHPRVNILNPGPGVGGYCIAVDPWFLISSAPDLAIITSTARKINTQKTDWVIKKVKEVIRKNNVSVVACLGLTYKSNTADIRQSPAVNVVNALEMEVKVLRVDPYVLDTTELYNALARAEIIVGLVAHSAFMNIPPNYLVNKIILDFAGIFK